MLLTMPITKDSKSIDLSYFAFGNNDRKLMLCKGVINDLPNMPEDETITFQFKTGGTELITIPSGLYDITKLVTTANDMKNKTLSTLFFIGMSFIKFIIKSD